MPEASVLSKRDLEEGGVFAPKFDSGGLIGAIVTVEAGGGVLMFAYMNAGALRLTMETGEAHFWILEPVAGRALAQGHDRCCFRERARAPR